MSAMRLGPRVAIGSKKGGNHGGVPSKLDGLYWKLRQIMDDWYGVPTLLGNLHMFDIKNRGKCVSNMCEFLDGIAYSLYSYYIVDTDIFGHI